MAHQGYVRAVTTTLARHSVVVEAVTALEERDGAHFGWAAALSVTETLLTDYGHTVALGKTDSHIEIKDGAGTVTLERNNRLWTFSPSVAVAQ